MSEDEADDKLPAKWWVHLRLAAILVTVWMAIGFFVLEHSFNESTKMSGTRTEQAAQLAGVPLSADERNYFGTPGDVPATGAGDRADQIVAIGSLAAFESDRSSDSVDGMIATSTAGVGSLVVFLSGLRGWLARRQARVRSDRSSRPRTESTGSPLPST